MGSDVAGRIRRAVEAEVPIYFKHMPHLGIQKDCPSSQSIKASARIDLAIKIQANIDVLCEIPGSLLDMLEKKHNIVTEPII